MSLGAGLYVAGLKALARGSCDIGRDVLSVEKIQYEKLQLDTKTPTLINFKITRAR